MEQEQNNPIKANNQVEVQERDPYAGIFYEIDTLIKQAEVSCTELLKPLTTREPKENELYAILEVFNCQDYGLNYNLVSKDLDIDFQKLGEASVIPGLQQHIETFLEGKTTSKEQDEGFDEILRSRIFDFFSKCWKEVGGMQTKTPTYFCFEKEEYELRDLRTGEILSEDEVSSRLESK
jgi:hypothetical protein